MAQCGCAVRHLHAGAWKKIQLQIADVTDSVKAGFLVQDRFLVRGVVERRPDLAHEGSKVSSSLSKPRQYYGLSQEDYYTAASPAREVKGSQSIQFHVPWAAPLRSSSPFHARWAAPPTSCGLGPGFGPEDKNLNKLELKRTLLHAVSASCAAQVSAHGASHREACCVRAIPSQEPSSLLHE